MPGPVDAIMEIADRCVERWLPPLADKDRRANTCSAAQEEKRKPKSIVGVSRKATQRVVQRARDAASRVCVRAVTLRMRSRTAFEKIAVLIQRTMSDFKKSWEEANQAFWMRATTLTAKTKQFKVSDITEQLSYRARAVLAAADRLLPKKTEIVRNALVSTSQQAWKLDTSALDKQDKSIIRAEEYPSDEMQAAEGICIAVSGNDMSVGRVYAEAPVVVSTKSNEDEEADKTPKSKKDENSRESLMERLPSTAMEDAAMNVTLMLLGKSRTQEDISTVESLVLKL